MLLLSRDASNQSLKRPLTLDPLAQAVVTGGGPSCCTPGASRLMGRNGPVLVSIPSRAYHHGALPDDFGGSNKKQVLQ
jgi:hypothetical protein